MTTTLPRVQLFDSPTGQWRLETGVGRLRSFAPNGPRYVEVTVDAPPLASPVTGWADRDTEPFAALFANGLGHAAIELHDVDVEYRVEVRRRQGIDRTVPLEELQPHEKRRRMVHLCVAGHDETPPDIAAARFDDAARKVNEVVGSVSDVAAQVAEQMADLMGHGAAPAEWDFSGFDFSNNPAMPQEPGLAWDKYRPELRRLVEVRVANQALDPSKVAFDDQLTATIRSWFDGIGLEVDERTVFTAVAALCLLRSGLVMRGRLCIATAHEIELLLSVFSMLVPGWVIVDA